MSNTTKNIAAANASTARYAAAKLDLWEANYWTKGSRRRTRKAAKRELNRAVRRAPIEED